jgi:hypothetical protein
VGTIIMTILGVAAIFGIATLLFSDKADPKERAVEATAAAAAGAAGTVGCLLQAVLSVLPILLGFFVIGLIVRSCS